MLNVTRDGINECCFSEGLNVGKPKRLGDVSRVYYLNIVTDDLTIL